MIYSWMEQDVGETAPLTHVYHDYCRRYVGARGSPAAVPRQEAPPRRRRHCPIPHAPGVELQPSEGIALLCRYPTLLAHPTCETSPHCKPVCVLTSASQPWPTLRMHSDAVIDASPSLRQVNAVARPRIKGRFVKPQELAEHLAVHQVGSASPSHKMTGIAHGNHCNEIFTEHHVCNSGCLLVLSSAFDAEPTTHVYR